MDDGRIVHARRMAELAADRALQQRLLGLIWTRTNERRRAHAAKRRQPLAATADRLAAAAAGAGVALVALPLVGISSTWVTLTVAGLAMGMMIFIMASGLTLVFGLMDVINFGHGVFISVGAYRRA